MNDTILGAIAEEIIILRLYDQSILNNNMDCKQSLTLSHRSGISSLLHRLLIKSAIHPTI